MTVASDSSDLQFSTDSEGVTLVAGDLREQNASDFELLVRTLVVEPGDSVVLDLHRLDIEDGVALATCINSLRELRARTSRIVLRGAPQMLGHNLYRTGILEGPAAIELVDMRLDEPSGF
jgi:anti-anti-sigma regulatory factor